MTAADVNVASGMAKGSKVDLIRLTDGESSRAVQILGRHMSGGGCPASDFLDAEIAVAGGFARGCLEVCPAQEDDPESRRRVQSPDG
ncbi:DUF5959 family protein [Streptomyces sp. NPDC002779]|uniref:DUF5959 family protein n=1 Tax=Streptomyces sp. NPDC002779 TaxID=3364664 RepID=UPI00367AE52F